MRPRRLFLASILATSLLAAGCLKELARTLAETQTLTEALTKKFGEPVFVRINEAAQRVSLSVSFINSALNDKAAEDRMKRAQEVANFIKTSYSRAKNLDTIWVFFLRQKTSMVVFHQTQTVDFFGFDKDAARLITSDNVTGIASYGVELRASATYLDKTNESDISASGIQLAGIPGQNGLTVLPHFRVKGDVRSAKARPPREVSLDFASYADTSQFAQITAVEFIADGKGALRTDGTFTGNKTQFCYLTVPYSAFRQMIDAKQLIIKLGDKNYPLTPNQLSVIRQMSNYVTEVKESK